MSNGRSDVIVVGGGTMGTAAGWALARRGHSVTVLELFHHINNLASHSGHTRIFRHAYTEGQYYVPWTLEADAAWVALSERTGIDLMVRSGCLDISIPSRPHARLSRDSAAAFDLPHEFLTGREVNERFPAWTLPDDWEACLDPEAGILIIEPTLRALVTEFRDAGGTLVENAKVTAWSETPDGVSVRTADGTYEADRLVITAGAWTSKVLAGLDLPLRVVRKPVMWFDVDDRALVSTDQFPAFVVDNGVEHYYGLPAYGDDSVKIGNHSDRHEVDPDTLNRNVLPEDMPADFRHFLNTTLKGVRAGLTGMGMCMYTMTPDEDFIIDRHPHHDRIVFAGGFSGHGYKFAPVVGELLADLTTDINATTPAHFALGRFSA